jgi:integrase
MRNALLVTVSRAEQTIAPGVFIRRRSRHLWIRFHDQRRRKQRESTHAVYEPGATPDTVIVPRGELKKAQRQLDRRRGEVATQRFVGAVERTLRFDELMRLVREDYELKDRRSTASLGSRIANLAGFFAGVRVSDITPGLITRYQLDRKHGRVKAVRRPRRDGKAGGRRLRPAANATVNRDLEVLKRAFRLAARKELVSHVPEFPEDLSEKHNVRQGFLEHHTYLALQRALPEDYADVLDFGYLVGWRKGSIHGLRWPSIDRAANVIYLPARDNKTGKPFRLWMFPELRAVVDHRWAKRHPETDLVFHVDGKPMGDWDGTWKQACRAAGVAGLLFHDLRRTATRNLIRAGIDPKVAMKITGHETEAMLRRYDISAEDDVRDAAVAYSAYLRRLATTHGRTSPARPRGVPPSMRLAGSRR